MIVLFVVCFIWAFPSFLLHNLLHEGSHAVIALAAGAKNIRMHLFPSNDLGYFTWAYVKYDSVEDTTIMKAMPASPIFIEMPWLIGFTIMLYTLPIGWWTGIIIVECISSVVDLTNWFSGYWNPLPNRHCDAEKIRATLGFDRWVGKLVSALLLVPMVVVVGGIVKAFMEI